MPCSKASVSKSFNCDQAGCISIPTDGKSCVCICENEEGDIVRCDDCKCFKTNTCQCKCYDSKCTCIVTKGADSICVSRDGRGNIKLCECPCVETKQSGCCMKDASVKLYGCCKKELENTECANCKCAGRREFKESRRVVTVSKDYKCDAAGCVCIPTDGRSCICVCEDENGDIGRCDDCKCYKSGSCQCKCDDSKCTCILTNGADCVSVCRDKTGNIKVCDCSCFEAEDARCCKKKLTYKSSQCCGKEKQARGGSSQCKEKSNFQVSRRDETVSKNLKCEKAGCVCIPTKGRSCICVCEDENGDIVRCFDCSCFKSGDCQCKCDDSKCTCIVTDGADCICLCRDKIGNIKVCDCSCFEAEKSRCCKKELTYKPSQCCSKNSEEQTRGESSQITAGKLQVSRRAETVSRNFKCEKVGCVCIPTKGRSCICVCEDENGDIVRCFDCKCFKSGDCQCKCDDYKCTCIVTDGADCICVCRDKYGNIKVCECSCIEEDVATRCRKEVTGKSRGCCYKGQEQKSATRNCKSDRKRDFKETRHVTTVAKNYKCDTAGCVCIPTNGNPCICICEDENGDIVRCDDCKCFKNGTCQCKCDDSKCTCILTYGADCICVRRDNRGNIKVCKCSCSEDDVKCCKKEMNKKPYGCCSKELEKKVCGGNCKCVGKMSRRAVSVSKKYSCDNPECVCIPTDGRPCICVCEDENGDIVRCDDCKCFKSGSCQCKCDDSKCTCILTYGADCVCVCRDKRGNIKVCECCCSEEGGRCKININVNDVDCKNCKCCSQKSCCETTGKNFEKVQNRYCGQNCICANNKKDKPKSKCCVPKHNESCMCCEKETSGKIRVTSSKLVEYQCCGVKEKSCGCCRDNNIQEERINYDSRKVRYTRVDNDGCACVTKNTTKSGTCCC